METKIQLKPGDTIELTLPDGSKIEVDQLYFWLKSHDGRTLYRSWIT